jgi:predicted TIM-barrel fold metal-dependent hydrolase
VDRRQFLQAALASAAFSQAVEPVLDIHLHLRKEPDSCFDHIQGCGVSKAVLLTRAVDGEKALAEIAKRPGSFVWFASVDPTAPGAIDTLRRSGEAGARGFGEMKNHIAADSPEMLRVYDLAAEMNVPVLIHFQEIPHFEGEGVFNTGYRNFDKVLKSHPKTTFIGHADLFWANISADVPSDVGYPSGPVKPGGLTDRWLSDYPNLYADMSANSGNNGLARDPDFSRGFIQRHRSKLLFGSDCNCADGHGTGLNMPVNARLQGKCVARATLELAKQLTTPDVFRKITWENGTHLLKIQA